VSETGNSNRVRTHFAELGARLFRNNCGVLKDRNGRPVRYGLANDSKALNQQLKSSDLIGWKPTLITPDMVGGVFAQFVSIEMKADGWRFRPTDERAVAQRRWLDMVRNDGGLAGFMIDPARGFEPC
jgi:hypothetical protein